MIGRRGFAAGSALLALTGRARAADIDRVVWALPAGVSRMDPVIADQIQTHPMSLTTETLMRFDNQGRPQPNLARQATQADLRTWIYDLRPDVRFWDGTPLAAEDVAYSLELQADPKTGGGWTAFYANVRRIDVTGPLQVTVRLKEPDPAWPFVPCWGAARIIQKAHAEAHKGKLGAPDALPIGTGPYRWTGFTPDEQVTLVRNESYWGEKNLPKSLVLRFIVDEATRQLAMRSGEIDAASTVPLDQADQWMDIPGIHMQFARKHQVAYFGFNTEQSPFDDVHARRAVAYCLDKKGLVTSVLAGHGAPARLLIPPSFWDGVQPFAKTELFYAGVPQYAANIERAKAELAQSKTPHGFTALVEYPDSRKPIGLAALALSQALKAIGVRLEVRELPTRQWRAKLDSFNYAMMVGTYSLSYSDPGAMPYNFYHSRFITEYAYNVGKYRNQLVDQWLDEQRTARDGAVRAALMQKVFQQVTEDLPLLPIWYQDIGIATRNLVFADISPWYSYQDWAAHLRPV